MTGSFSISVEGSPVDRPPARVIVSNRKNQPDMVEIHYHDDNREVLKSSSPFAVGKKLKVEASVGGTQKSVLAEVEVIGFEAIKSESGQFFSVIKALDATHRLQRGMFTQTWENKTAADIAGDLAGLCGLQKGQID